MKSNQGVCTYCGRTKKMTDEHVVPKGLFIDDHKTVIPVCKKCNNDKANDDEYFRLVFALLKESEEHSVAQKVIKKVERSLNNPNQKGFQSMIESSADNLFVKDENGNLVKNTGLKVEVNRINTTFEYITKGLFYLETGTRLPDQYHVVSTFGREEDSNEGKAKIQSFRKYLANKPWKEIGEKEVFKYRYCFSIDNISQSVWEMKIYNGKSTIALIANKM